MAYGLHKLAPLLGATNYGPSADVAQVNARQRRHFGYLADQSLQMFTIVEGNSAVNASNLGEGWAYRIYRKRGSSWQSPLFVSPEACSIRRAGVPADIAQSFERKLHERLDLSGETFTPCWKPEPDVRPDTPAVKPAG